MSVTPSPMVAHIRRARLAAAVLVVVWLSPSGVTAHPTAPGATATTSASSSAATVAETVAEAPITTGANGRLPRSAVRPAAGVLLAPAAARDLARLLAAAERDGAVIAVTDGYRSFDRQVDLKQRKGWLAARPGTSQHGWGLAVDFDTRVTDFAWLRRNAADHGWFHPAWAQPGGSKPEPWHWEHVGGPADLGGPDGHLPEVTAPVVREPGALVATARFEPVYGEVGGWFAIHSGLDALETGPRHYPGTADPGGVGNFAVAGYRQAHGAPLAGVERLWAGDLVRVRTSAGDEHLYRVVERRDLTGDDGWAVGDDPLGTGTSHVLTVTTAAPDGGLSVVWAVLV